ncbi:MAG: hypothetical protein AB7F28_06015 [Candidatus Margulisiibacteriota bacterium]
MGGFIDVQRIVEQLRTARAAYRHFLKNLSSIPTPQSPSDLVALAQRCNVSVPGLTQVAALVSNTNSDVQALKELSRLVAAEPIRARL